MRSEQDLLLGMPLAFGLYFVGTVLFDSMGAAALSVIFLLFTYFGSGMVKTALTVRTGNAWVHAWAYHALAPHTFHDAPLITRIFQIKP